MFYSVFSQSGSDFDLCALFQYVLLLTNCMLTILEISRNQQRHSDDDDSEQKINIGRTLQVVLPNRFNMQYFVTNEYLAKREEITMVTI